MSLPSVAFSLGDRATEMTHLVSQWQEEQVGRRIWAKDPTVWAQGPTPEIIDRLGWLTLPETMVEPARAFGALAIAAKSEGVRHVVVLGMGGSSLAPEVLARTFGPAPGYPEVFVLDSTHPDAIEMARERLDLAHTWFVISSKSGTTLETLSLFRYFWNEIGEGVPTRGDQFIAVTDPGTPLEKLGHDRNFRTVVQATPDVGGRYSALTAFGLVPGALLGMDLQLFLSRARGMVRSCAPQVPEAENPGIQLGAALGCLGRIGIDKVTFVTSPELSWYPLWAEQLIAESTGKEGRGLIPVAGETLRSASFYDRDRVFVSLRTEGEAEVPGLTEIENAGHPVIRCLLSDRTDLGAEFFLWEMAIACAGAALGIQPFNQPDVELAKQLARQVMDGSPSGSGGNAPPPKPSAITDRSTIDAWFGSMGPRLYVAIQAYVAPTAEMDHRLETLRKDLGDRLRLPVTVGYGPRFLHSTGQLHKGGPASGRFLQLIDEPSEDLAVPETKYSFGQIIRAQADGDAQALLSRDRVILRLTLGTDADVGAEALAAAIATASTRPD
jgi:transaldolase/glucose-6-phosphate isomerase